MPEKGTEMTCEICGAIIPPGKGHRVLVDNTVLLVCDSCYSKIMSRKKVQQSATSPTSRTQQSISRGLVRSVSAQSESPAARRSSTIYQQSKGARQSQSLYEKYELVEDYAERIRRAREALGWSQAVLAAKVKVSENIIKRIESGKLRPSHDLAKRLEEVLNIKLLVPAVEDMYDEKKESLKEVTLGEIVRIREGNE
ncbi:MAG: TIGR00270 family protein [Ignisphaera sp.]|nr:TIGR00270 family protein [Ignisphaera sp.]